MRKRMLRSVLVAAFSAVVAFGVVGAQHSGTKSHVQADSHWPAVVAASAFDSHWPVSPAGDEPGELM
jgi:hypothetical protein